jgi:hypothetical protein
LCLLVDAPREREHLTTAAPSALAGDLEYRADPGDLIVALAPCKLQLSIDHDDTSFLLGDYETSSGGAIFRDELLKTPTSRGATRPALALRRELVSA